MKDHYCQSQFLVFNYLHYCCVPNPQAGQCPLVLCTSHTRVSVCSENAEQLMSDVPEVSRNWSHDMILKAKAMNSLLLHSLFFCYNLIILVCLPGHLSWLKVHKHLSRTGVWGSSSLWANAETQANSTHLSETARQSLTGKEVERQHHETEVHVKTLQNYWEFAYAIKWSHGRNPTTSGNH